MDLYLYNTLSRQKELFKPINPDEIGIYNCGPTVYWYAHIGNLRTYIFEDILRRVLEYNGYKTKEVMNITDVGHLTSDADEGEDKIVKAAKKEKKTVWEIAEFYTDAFKKDLHSLNILEPRIWCKATDHIQEQINLIKQLEQKGFTYEAGGNVYFDTSKVLDYGKLALLRPAFVKTSAGKQGFEEQVLTRPRVELDPNKKNSNDFVLWFTKSKFERQDMKWESPWGLGYPGWHLECSAMSMKYLGEHFDIHCGGIDHIGVHHTNEIAQSDSAVGHKVVNYWLHGEFLSSSAKATEDKKMSKSLGNIIRLADIIEKGFNPLAFRYLCLSAHYRTPLNFSWEALKGAENALVNLYKNLDPRLLAPLGRWRGDDNRIPSVIPVKMGIQAYKDSFFTAINDDLNMPQALAVIWNMIKDPNVGAEEKKKLLLDFDKVLGLGLENVASFFAKAMEDKEIPEEIQKLADLRAKARTDKNWMEADTIRKQIEILGYKVEDTDEQTIISKLF